MPETTAPAELIAPGQAAPDFTLPDQDRADWSLAEHAKRAAAAGTGEILLCFYPFAFTSVCGEEMACLTTHLAELDAAGRTVIGISCDSPAANKAWAERDGFKHPLLSDLHREVVKAYGLHWAELNVARRGTVLLAPAPDNTASPSGLVAKWTESREPGHAMDWGAVVGQMA